MDIGEVGEATSEAEIALKLAPNFSKAQNAMGIVLARQQRYPEAEPYFTKARDLDRSDPMPYYNLAQMIVEQNRKSDGSVDPTAIDRAIDITRAGVAASPNDADGYQRLGNLYAQRGNLQGALQEFEKAAILRPRDENIRQNIGILRAKIAEQTGGS
jgi:Flp pilus assembly protein TadD